MEPGTNWPALDFVLRHALTGGGLLVLVSWGSMALGAALAYLFQTPGEARKSPRGFLRFCFPAEMFRHRSVRVDVVFVAVAWVIDKLLIVPALLSNGAVTFAVWSAMQGVFGMREGGAQSWWSWAALLVGSVVFQDFVNFFRHYLEHKVPALWEFHKVHHSAEFLVPLSNRRQHPGERFMELMSGAVVVGAFVGVACYLLGLPPTETVLMGMDAYFLCDVLSFYQLRHSHIALSFGRFERFVMSPAQHHLHHSCEVRDWDINFGTFLAVWDRLFGTFRPTDTQYRFRMGLGPEEQGRYDSVPKLLAAPFLGLWRMFGARGRAAPGLPPMAGSAEGGD